MRKSFTTRGFTPIGRTSSYFGADAESKYVGGGFIVTYEKRQRKSQLHLYVMVDMDGHGRIHEGFTATSITPSIETAKIHSSAAFRTHFGLMNGDPHEHVGSAIKFCRCGYDDPSRARHRDADGLPVDPDRDWTPVAVAMPVKGRDGVVRVRETSSQTRMAICRECDKEFEAQRRGKQPSRCPECRDKAAAARQQDLESKRWMTCGSCSQQFERKSLRGRKPTQCYDCKEKDAPA